MCPTGCYSVVIPCCESPVIYAGLTAAQSYTAIVRKIGSTKEHHRNITADNTGAFVIDKTTLPDGFFACGCISLKLMSVDLTNTVELMTFEGVQYACALLEIRNID